MSQPSHSKISERSVNSLIEKAIEQVGTHTPKGKRKAKDQQSSEKDKPHKLINNTLTSPTPATSPKAQTNKNTTANMSEDKDRPRMLRHSAKGLDGTPCVSAFHTREAILTRDAEHPLTTEVELTLNDVRHKISDFVLDNKYQLMDSLDKALKDLMIKALAEKDALNATFFTSESDSMGKLTDSAFQIFLTLCDSNTELQKDTNGHYNNAKKALATELSSNIPIVLNTSKDELTPFLTVQSRGIALNKELNELIIRGANFDKKWMIIIHKAMPTAKSNMSTFTLANTMNDLQNTTEKNEHDIVEIDHQITKLSVRVGDLKTSEMETRFQQVENVIRLHNINTIGEGTPNHFRALTYQNQHRAIDELVSQNLSSGSRFNINIVTPKDNSRHFEPLAIITFDYPAAKYEFEKNLADYRRKTPTFKVTSSRPAPQKTISDRDQPDIQDIKGKIGMLYNQKVEQALKQNPNIPYKPLNTQEIDAITVQLKTKRKPFATYYEFLCPTNNTTFMVYTPSINPFQDYDFNQPIANPLTRKHAVSDPKYKNRYPAKVYNRRK